MATEIERKFLVIPNKWPKTVGTLYKQGYLSRHPERVVRVRCIDKRAFLTIKGKVENYSRAEFEYEIPLADAEVLLELCEKPIIEKTRYKLNHEGHLWEIDEFHGENAGLVLAEIELLDEKETFVSPVWLGEEVTEDMRYYNSNLIANPYSRWS